MNVLKQSMSRRIGMALLVFSAADHVTLEQARAEHKAGYENIRFVEGGMSQWVAKGWPMVAPSK